MKKRLHKLTKAGRQIGGMAVTADWINSPKRAASYMREVAEQGYIAAVLWVFHMKQTLWDKAVHDAVSALVDMGHELGLKMILGSDPDMSRWGPVCAEQYPETALWAIRPVATSLYNGVFDVRVPFPNLPATVVFERLVAVFCSDGNQYRPVSLSNVESEWMAYGVPSAGVTLQGRIKGKSSGRLALYVAFKSYGAVDVAHPRFLKTQEQLLDMYRDIPLDGFAWDEPGKGMSDMGCFKAGLGFLDLFKKLNGYDLRSRIIFMDHLDGEPEAVRTRCDYYRTLVEMNYIAQDRHNRYARKLFGKDLVFGTHHTWSGIPADLVAGDIDYFKLGRVVTSAWTDGSWDSVELKYPVYNFMLAEGLKKELGYRDAYYNDWGITVPGVENMRFASRLKMLFHVNWYNHCFSDNTDQLINFRQEPIRSRAKECVADLDRFDALIADRYTPHTEVALVHTWETLAATPKWLTRVFYTSIVNTALHLLDKSLFAGMMSGENLLNAQIAGDRFMVNGVSYQVLVMPFAHVLQEDVYRKAMKLSEAGIPVIVYGPPPEFIAENGKRIGEDFAWRVGIEPITIHDYMRAYAEQSPVPAILEWEPSWVEVTYPLTITTGRGLFDLEGRLTCVQSRTSALYYLPMPDPREELTLLLGSLVKPVVKVFAEDTYYRFFSSREEADQQVVVGVAKAHIPSFALAPDRYGGGLRPPIKRHLLKALFRFPDGELEMHGGTWCAVEMDGKEVRAIIGDCPDTRWNGRKISEAR